MAVSIRLTRRGNKKRPFYRIVVADKEFARDGRFLEVVGTYNPLVDPPVVTLKKEKIQGWIDKGAVPSATVSDIIQRDADGTVGTKAGVAKAKAKAKGKTKVKAKAEAKTEEKVEAKAEAKAEETVEAKTEDKAEAKAEDKVEAKTEDKAEAKAEDKTEDKAKAEDTDDSTPA